MEKHYLKDGREYIIRLGVSEDAENVMEYLDKVAGESDNLTFGVGEFTTTLEEERRFIESANTDNKCFAVAILDGKVIGNTTFIGGARPRIKHVGEMGISVVKEYWGNRVGTELMNYLVKWAKENGVVKKINLRVRVDNKNAISLYENIGFKMEGKSSRQFYIRDKFYDIYMMGMEI